MEKCYKATDLIAINDLVSDLLLQNNFQISDAWLELTTDDEMNKRQQREEQEHYQIISDSAACVRFMLIMLTNMMSEQESHHQSKIQRFEKFQSYVNANIIKPVGKLISEQEINKIITEIDKKYGLLKKLFTTKKLTILRIPNTNKFFNSVCCVSRQIGQLDDLDYTLFLFHTKHIQGENPCYIFLHELGHILQTEITHNYALIPSSFIKMSNEVLGTNIDQGKDAPELFADAFAMAMMQTFGWEEYDPFYMIATEVKQV